MFPPFQAITYEMCKGNTANEQQWGRGIDKFQSQYRVDPYSVQNQKIPHNTDNKPLLPRTKKFYQITVDETNHMTNPQTIDCQFSEQKNSIQRELKRIIT